MIESYLVQSSEGPARKYYRMSRPGRAALEQWRQDWEGFKRSVDAVLDGAER
jgi:PadR family transcriptional regulator PadR